MLLEEKLKLFKEKGYTYDPETGLVTSHKGKIIKGKSGRYKEMCMSINKKTYKIKVSQFAWYIIYNEIPNVIDHINRNSLDDRISNLRNVTQSLNCFNKFGKGYYIQYTYKNPYRAYIRLNKRTIHLGGYKTAEEAHKAYLDAKKIYHIIK
jgi:hypothetical protein